MHHCHIAMRPYLAEVEAQQGLPIKYQRWSSFYEEAPPFRHEIEIFGPTAGLTSLFGLPYKGELRTVQVSQSQAKIGEQVVVSLGENNYLLAVVQGRRIALTFDLESLFESPQLDIQPGIVLEQILKLAVPMAAQNIKDYGWLDEVTGFTRWNVSGIETQVATWKENIRQNEFELDRLATTCASLVRKNSELREQSKAAMAVSRKDRQNQAADDFLNLTKMMPLVVQSLDLTHGKLIVVLQPLTLEHDGCDYEMGSYTLHISDTSVRIHSDKGARYPHPHVSAEGTPCWGNIGPHIGKMLGERQYTPLVATIVEFLHSYNEHDAYQKIEKWDPNWDDDD